MSRPCKLRVKFKSKFKPAHFAERHGEWRYPTSPSEEGTIPRLRSGQVIPAAARNVPLQVPRTRFRTWDGLSETALYGEQVPETDIGAA